MALSSDNAACTVPPALAPGEVHVWSFTARLATTEWPRSRQILSADELARAARLPGGGPRERFIAARVTLRQVLAQYLERPPEDLRFTYGDRGKPYLSGDIAFSLSHAGPRALLAVTTDGEIGADMEATAPFPQIARMAEHFFSSGEAAAVLGEPEPERARRFFTCWTRKEAYLKAIGVGVSVPLSRLDVVDPADFSPRLRPPAGFSERFRLVDIDLGSDFCGALAVPPSVTTISPLTWTTVSQRGGGLG